jgi:hypothetical protein
MELGEGTDLGELVEFLLYKSESHQLVHRKVLETAQNKNRVSKIANSSKADAQLVSGMLYKGRKVAKHQRITRITESSNDWPHLKDLTKLIKGVATELDMSLESLLRVYVPQFIQSMGKSFRINRYRSVHEITCRNLESTLLLEKDPTPSVTKEVHDIYLDEYEERTGVRPKPMWMYPEVYVNFLYAKELSVEMGVSSRELIESQFEGLEWANSAPEPNQLHGEKAEGRLRKYLYSKRREGLKNSGSKSKKTKSINWGFLKREIE